MVGEIRLVWAVVVFGELTRLCAIGFVVVFVGWCFGPLIVVCVSVDDLPVDCWFGLVVTGCLWCFLGFVT